MGKKSVSHYVADDSFEGAPEIRLWRAVVDLVCRRGSGAAQDGNRLASDGCGRPLAHRKTKPSVATSLLSPVGARL